MLYIIAYLTNESMTESMMMIDVVALAVLELSDVVAPPPTLTREIDASYNPSYHEIRFDSFE